MTREQELIEAATSYGNEVAAGSEERLSISHDFLQGARWADANTPDQWIKVTNRLPPKIKGYEWSDMVLVALDDGSISSDFYIPYLGRWLNHLRSEITHWMPMSSICPPSRSSIHSNSSKIGKDDISTDKH